MRRYCVDFINEKAIANLSNRGQEISASEEVRFHHPIDEAMKARAKVYHRDVDSHDLISQKFDGEFDQGFVRLWTLAHERKMLKRLRRTGLGICLPVMLEQAS